MTLRLLAAALVLAPAIPAQAIAQAILPAPTPTADALAAQMRILAASPRDLTALVTAADLSTRLADPEAALGFLTRAQAVDATNPRIVAARANAYVMMERPGEALRLFAEAQARGVPMTPYLAQRGLAYDLIGQSVHAQQDYRQASRTDPDDETTRRLALSLGISGQRDEALVLLDPLIRRNDRAAWRARACVLALSGDVRGAQAIATSMMPGGAAFAPFFARLPTLALADRAFAVHFGSMNPSPARMADARMAPPLTPIAPVRTAPVAVAAVAPVATPARQRGRRSGRQPIDIATPPSTAGRANVTNVTLTSSVPKRPPAAAPSAPRVPVKIADLPPAASGRDWTAALSPLSAPPPAASASVVASASPPVRTADVLPERPPVSGVPDTPAATVASAPAARVAQPSARTAPAVRTPEVARRNTALLASIIETIAVPQSELTAPRAARSAGTRKPVVAASAWSSRAGAPPKPETADVKTAKKPDPKTSGKVEPKKPDPAKAEPARWWVQVAGGANEGDLGKEWKKLTTKAATSLRGRAAWTTPLRATNRLLAGPFKTQGEAMALVNRLRKDDVASFAWQSEAGQKVAKLPAR